MTRAAARVLLVLAAVLTAVALGAIELQLHPARKPFEEMLVTFRPLPALAALLALGVALAAPVRALAALRRGDLAALRSPAILGAIAAVLCTFATGWQVHLGHESLRRLLPSRPWAVFNHVPEDAYLVVVVGAGAALTAALWGTAAFAWARRRGSGPTTLVAVVASALSAILAADGLVRAAAGALALDEGCYGGEPASPEVRLLLLEEVNAPLAPLRLTVLIVAALGTVLILALARREPATRPAPRVWLLPGGVFALGVLAVVLTSGVGHDVRHPPPLWRDAPSAVSSGWLPAVDSCPPERRMVDAPEVHRLDDGRWFIHGTVDDARGVVEVLRAKRELWKLLLPNFPGVAYLRAGADAPFADIAPFIVAAREAGYPRIQGLQRLPAKHWPTRTLGDLPYTPRLCAAPLPAVLAVSGTWAEALR